MKIHSLEAIRGVASWVVVFWHFTSGFLPLVLGARVAPPWGGLAGTPLFFLFNGTGAVYLFFVLSGYVLTLKYFVRPDPAALIVGMVKRWPRLAGPVLVTVLAAMALYALDGYRNQEAAHLTGSLWLLQDARVPVGDGFEPSWPGAVIDALYRTFFGPGSLYNTNLWTMRLELLGSYLAWFMAIALAALPRSGMAFLMIPPVVLGVMSLSAPLAPFAAGVGLAYAHARGVFRANRRWAGMGMIAAALLLLSLHGAQGWLAPLRDYDLPWYRIRPLAYTVGSLLLIHAVLHDASLRRRGDGLLGRWLGRLSFPVYLVHTLVLSTVTSWIIVQLQTWPAALAFGVAALATVAAVLALAVPLAWFDEWWTRLVSKAATVACRQSASRLRRLVAGVLRRQTDTLMR